MYSDYEYLYYVRYFWGKNVYMKVNLFSLQGTIEIGGIGKTWEIAAEKGRLNLFK